MLKNRVQLSLPARSGTLALRGKNLPVLLLAALASMTGTGGVRAETAFRTCVPRPAGGVPVSGPDANGLFAGADGKVFFATDIRKPRPKVRATSISAKGLPILKAYSAGPANRWNLTPAWLVYEGPEGPAFYQTVALEAGNAVFAPSLAGNSCGTLLRESEAKARAKKNGLWSTGRRILSAHQPETFDGLYGTYVIVRGNIVSLGKTERTRYLNFGRHWKTDFTVTLKASDEITFDAALERKGSNRSIAALTGSRVEIRGTVENRDGPHIALSHPAQIVVLEE